MHLKQRTVAVIISKRIFHMLDIIDSIDGFSHICHPFEVSNQRASQYAYTLVRLYHLTRPVIHLSVDAIMMMMMVE